MADGRAVRAVNREQLAHLARAAAEVSGDNHVIIIGSQAVLASWPEADLPEEATRSVEADITFLDDPLFEKAEAVNGAQGEMSPFQQTHGYYAEGVALSVAVLADGWEGRLVAFDSPGAFPAEARALSPLDVVIAKLARGEEKDIGYAAALMGAGKVDLEQLFRLTDLLSHTVHAAKVRRMLKVVQRRVS